MIIDSLADALSVDRRQLVARHRTVEADVELSDLTLDSIVLDHLTVVGDLTLRSCQAERLSMHEVSVQGAVVIRECALGSLDLRQVRAIEGCRLIRVRAADAILHDVPALDLFDVSSSGALRVSAPGPSLALKDVRADDLEIADARHHDLAIAVERVRCAGLLYLRDLTIAGISLSDVSAGRLRAVDCSTRGTPLVAIRDATLSGDMIVESSRAGGMVVAVIRCRVAGDLDLSELRRRPQADEPDEEVPVLASLSNTTVQGDLGVTAHRERARRYAVELRDSSVAGRLAVRGTDDGRAPTVVRLAGHSDVADVMIPAEPRITIRNAEQVVLSMFDASDRASLQTMRSALNRQRRHNEADAVYYCERSQTVPRVDVTHHPVRALLGPALGWGVRIGAPVCCLFGLVALASLVTYFYAAVHGNCVAQGHSHRCTTAGWGPRSAVSAVAEAGAAFFAVSVGGHDTPRGVIWDIFTVLGAGIGLLLTTVVVGIIIRRLVR